MKSFFRKVAIVFAAVFILFFIGYQIYKNVVPEYRTEAGIQLYHVPDLDGGWGDFSKRTSFKCR